jgi:hypothetical protein
MLLLETVISKASEFAAFIGLNSPFELFVVAGMLIAGFLAKWTFQFTDHNHDHHDD